MDAPGDMEPAREVPSADREAAAEAALAAVRAVAGIGEGTGTDFLSSMRTDAEGRFSWSGFRSGAESSVVIEIDGRERVRSATIVGEPGEVVPEEVLVLYDYGGIEGVATDGDGNPIANAEIDVVIAFGDNRSLRFSLRTDELGEFVALDRMPATEIYIDMRIASGAGGLDASSTWQSKLLEIPAAQVVMLGAVSFTAEGEPERKREAQLARTW